MSNTILAPARFHKDEHASKADWLRFDDNVHSNLLRLFKESGIAVPKDRPVEENHWRDLAICLAIKSGELSVDLGGESLPPLPITLQTLDRMKETKERIDYRPALDKDNIKDELFRFFFRVLQNEADGVYKNHISRVMWRRYYKRKTLYIRDYGFPPAIQKLSLRFQQCAEMDRLRGARKVLRPNEVDRPKKDVTIREAARYAAAELHLWIGENPPTANQINKTAENIRSGATNRKAIKNGPSDVPHPRLLALMRIQRIYGAIDHAARRLCSPLSRRV